MTNNEIANLLMIVLVIMIIVLFTLVIAFLVIKARSKQKEKPQKEENTQNSDKSKIQQLYNVQSIFNFMEFDKIEDNMIIQKKGKKYSMVVKCQGINFDLMSNVEKGSVEQGFTEYLNTLRKPIQIYVQTRTVDLTGSLSTYKQKVRELGDNLARKEFDYNQKIRSGNYEITDLQGEKFEITKARNLYEYGTDIVNNTERMSLNKNILTRQYYIVLSHYPEEASSDIYAQEEINNLAFSELYTRAQSTISLLSVCGINSKILDSYELADLLYAAYNRDEAEVYDLKRAINAGYDSLYTTAPDIIDKKIEELDKKMEEDAIRKAGEVVNEVRHEKENERRLKEKERNYDELVDQMVQLVIENNRDILGDDIADSAKEKVTQKITKKKTQKKEVKTNEQESTKRTRRTRKSA